MGGMDVTDLDPAEVLSVSRALAHPPAAVFAAFTEPDRLAAWFGPPGWSVPRESVLLEVWPGGRQRFRRLDTGYEWQSEFAHIITLRHGRWLHFRDFMNSALTQEAFSR